MTPPILAYGTVIFSIALMTVLHRFFPSSHPIAVLDRALYHGRKIPAFISAFTALWGWNLAVYFAEILFSSQNIFVTMESESWKSSLSSVGEYAVFLVFYGVFLSDRHHVSDGRHPDPHDADTRFGVYCLMLALLMEVSENLIKKFNIIYDSIYPYLGNMWSGYLMFIFYIMFMILLILAPWIVARHAIAMVRV